MQILTKNLGENNIDGVIIQETRISTEILENTDAVRINF